MTGKKSSTSHEFTAKARRTGYIKAPSKSLVIKVLTRDQEQVDDT